MGTAPPIRSLAPEEGSFEIPLWGVPLILVILWVCLFSGLGAIGLVGPDEPRYAAIARAMAETHDWITPRLWGTPWFEKPVLYYWAAGLSMRLFGVSEFAARLPSALAGLLAVGAAVWAALRSYGLGAGWYTLLMLPTSVAMIGFSRAAGPDMLFAAFLTASMAVAVEMLQKENPGPILQIAFGFFLGAAVLAKGPAAVILAGGATLAWAALSRQWLAPFRFLHPLVIAAFCVTALPWYVLCALRNPDFLRVFIWQHNFERYTTPIFEHRQPVWYYGPILLLALLPWLLFLFGGLYGMALRIKSKAPIDSNSLFFISWAVFPILFFSLSQSKLPGYILPAIPPLFVLLVRWVSKLIPGRATALIRALDWTAVLILLFLVPPLGAGFIAGIRDMFPGAYLQPALIMALLAIGILLSGFRKKVTAGILLLALMVTVTVEIANFAVLPELDIQISPRRLAQRLHREGVSADSLATYQFPRTWKYGLDYYMNRELPDWTPGNEPEWVLGEAPRNELFVSRYKVADDQSFERIPLFPTLFHRK